MARNVWDEPIDKNIPWDGNENTNNLPVRGSRVEEFLKGSLNSKIGVLYYDTTNNRYLAFADEQERDKYIADPTQTDLVLGTFDAPFNYSAEINLATPSYNAVFVGSTGHYIDFTFDVKNKQGASTGESVIIKYTFMRGATKQEVSEIKPFGSSVHFNIDKYLSEGTNTIIVSVTGQNTLAATSVAITYEVVNLQLSDGLDISKVYNLSNGTAVLDVPYTISGYGTKIVEWYIDGEQLAYVKSEDEIVESNTTRTKHITLSNLNQGKHSLQFRAYTTVNGEKFYTDTLYRDIIIYTGINSDMIISIAVTIPSSYGVLGEGEQVKIYNMVQYVPYALRFATYSPSNLKNVEVLVKVDNEVKSTVSANNDTVNNVVITPTTDGTKTVSIEAGNIKYELTADVLPTSMNIQEITNGLVLDFSASGKTNESSDKDSWRYGAYVGTLTGFAWNNTSGWVNNRLEMTAGSRLDINYAPLANNPTALGKTIEIEWSTKNVKDDNAVICDLRNSSGVGIVIYGAKVSMTSADGVTIETEYKSDENVRIAFVINRSAGSTHQRMSFIYANGILSRGDEWAITDNYTSNTNLSFRATEDAEVSLKAIRIYDNALSSDNILNNYILYRDTVAEMMEVYDRNDVYEEGRDVFSPTKMSSRLPVMIVTGDIPTLENSSVTDTQIVVDIEYTNLQDPTRSFKMVGAAMRPQGTSSMSYPKKNFRIYTQKLDTTIVYDASGNVVADKLYSFKKGAQPVNCWCLKADYAESSGTHNTGIARLWNDALYNARVTTNLGTGNPHNVNNAAVLRTNAQKIAAQNGYEYDVRTTIDGFPILLFYRPSANDDVIFIGKYNFNNDKSTESVFGFKGVPGFVNTYMQCWEVLNNGSPLALFTTTENFDTMWSEAFESRYPDTETPDISGLKAFAVWMSTVTQARFATEKWEHMDVYKMAAYWVYLMRHAGADQFVKNAMFTSEDGIHFYYILYDNDTINGLINSGRLTIKPTDNRQTVDAKGDYVFAGHSSRLWNMLEADEEFIKIVSAVDNALYSAGISYNNTIHIFDDEQADKWVERVYNQDAMYKYVSPYVEKGTNNLFMLQGKRDLHRRWWLAKRFSIYDAKYVSGQYKSLAIVLKCANDTPAGQQFTVTAGYPLDYGYGINNDPAEFGVPLEIGESHTFYTPKVINLGDPIRIYGAPNIAELDLSPMIDRITEMDITNVYDDAQGTKLTTLILGGEDKENIQVSEISGLRQASLLEYLDIQGMKNIVSLDLTSQLYFKTLKAHNTNLASVTFAKGATVERLELPSSMRVLTFEQLPLLDGNSVVMENMANVQYITITNCPNISNDFEFINNWYKSKTSGDRYCSLSVDNVSWTVSKASDFINLLSLKSYNAISLKGVVVIPNITIEQIYAIRDILGETAFNPDTELYIDVPTILQINSESNSMLDGSTLQLSTLVYPPTEGTYEWSVSGRDKASIDNNGLLTVTETGLATSSVVVGCKFTSDEGEILTASKTISVIPRVYPSSVTISGDTDPRISPNYSWETTTEGVNGDIITEWTLSGTAATYWSISNANSQTCTLNKKSAMLSNTTGTLTLVLKKRVDGSTIATVTKSLSMTVTFPANATINGEADPTKGNKTYTWSTTTANVNGEYYAEWALSGDITTIVEISSQDTNSCVMNMLTEPIDLVSGTLTLTLKKTANDATILTATKALEAMIEGVCLTRTGDSVAMNALYKAGVASNENYLLKEEAATLTETELQTILGAALLTDISWLEYTSITSFGVTWPIQFNHRLNGTLILPETCTTVALGKSGQQTKMTLVLSKNVSEITNYGWLYNSSTTITKDSNFIRVVDDNQYFKDVDGVLLLSKDGKICYGISTDFSGEIIMPEGVEEIKGYYDLNYLKLTLPSSLTTLNKIRLHDGACVEILGNDPSIFEGTSNSFTFQVYYSSNANVITPSTWEYYPKYFIDYYTPAQLTGEFTIKIPDNIKIVREKSIKTPTQSVNVANAVLNIVLGTETLEFYNQESVGTTSRTTVNVFLNKKIQIFNPLSPLPENLGNLVTNIYALDGLDNFTLTDNYLIENATKTLIWYTLREDNAVINIPEGVEVIGSRFLSDQYEKYPSGVIFPQTLKTIKTNALINSIWSPTCVDTIEVTPNVVIESRAFRYCGYTGTVIITNIGELNSAVFSYSKISKVILLGTTTSIAQAFHTTTNFNELVIEAETPPVANGRYIFGGLKNFFTLRVPPKSIDLYIQWMATIETSLVEGTYGVKPAYTPTECTNLSITAEDVTGNMTNTRINYIATTNGESMFNGERVENIEISGYDTSDEFPQNTSYTDTIERTISYTYLGVTATTTITQGVWKDRSYTLDLNEGQWELSESVPNPGSTIYDGPYQSVKSKGVNDGYDTMYIDIFGYETFQLYIRSYAESNYDYVMVSQLDQTITGSTSYSNTTLVKAHTRGNQTGTTGISGYTLVEFTGIDEGAHRITVVYRKDSSANANDDRGYVLIPKNQ